MMSEVTALAARDAVRCENFLAIIQEGSGSSEYEKLTAASKFGNILRKHGWSVAHLFGGATASSNCAQILASNAALQGRLLKEQERSRKLEQRALNLQQRVDELEQERILTFRPRDDQRPCQGGVGTPSFNLRSKLTSSLSPGEKIEAEGAELRFEQTSGQGRRVSRNEFEVRVRMKAGHDHWRTAFAHAAQIPLRVLRQHLLEENILPELVGRLSKLKAEALRPASRQRWSQTERDRLKQLVASDCTDLELARILSGEFHRRIFESGVARQRRQLGLKAVRPGRRSAEHADDREAA
jgi:hypothetical protein